MKQFSLWCDFVEDSFLDNEFVELLYSKINGATSNPLILKNVILTPAYKSKIANLRGKKSKEIYENIAMSDICKAADRLAYNFEKGNDGFISLEIDPRLYDNTSLSIGEAKRLHSAMGRQNIMMKIPATEASYEVMYELMKSGISVNATLIFSGEQNKKCFEALNEGLRAFRKAQAYSKAKEPQAVISVFVSRLDRILNERVSEPNQIGVLNAKLAYNYIMAQNEPNIRALFASTGVKGDDLPKDFYIRELYLERALNTAPLDAIRAFNGECEFKATLSDEELQKKLNKLVSKELLDETCNYLIDGALKNFCFEFDDLLAKLSS
ncbi:transaldolase [Campylobacter vulpis]|uniref:Transaldolase n=1 Tax=Campylobacter vulpis TaxID=1655500 RepID=A0A2G4R2C6_9BACT|nr:transaldolase [Campylobacter vulpis]MBS4274990.1 transaldolase [Campylobacter vulpis]MBS4306169.1 transaldolase [Campylobacter vulpis]MBS4329177.1 transaldolase [Campylobacter vulpis]MBS4330755.1 transaldolase [Campylobacter vulpis]MBS4422713.1 transaldolase [Campylobacter vulpis]